MRRANSDEESMEEAAVEELGMLTVLTVFFNSQKWIRRMRTKSYQGVEVGGKERSICPSLF
jgi:hypothetical protein